MSILFCGLMAYFHSTWFGSINSYHLRNNPVTLSMLDDTNSFYNNSSNLFNTTVKNMMTFNIPRRRKTFECLISKSRTGFMSFRVQWLNDVKKVIKYPLLEVSYNSNLFEKWMKSFYSVQYSQFIWTIHSIFFLEINSVRKSKDLNINYQI